MNPHELITRKILPNLTGIKKLGGYYMARCPVHDDHEASLKIQEGSTQPVVLHCFAGCDSEAILEAIGLRIDDVLQEKEQVPTSGEWAPGGSASAVYDYRDEKGHLLYQVLRIPEPGGRKAFRQRQPDHAAKGGWRWNLNDVQRVLYRLPQLIEALDQGQAVYIVEGEKDVETLVRMGLVATTNSGGAGKWLDEFTDYFCDAHVKIIADKDKPGQAHARRVADSISEVASSVTILEPPTEKDVTEHLSTGKKLDDLLVTWSSVREDAVDLAPDLHVFLATVDPPSSWVIPGLMERGDRLVWTGFEGLGKAWWSASSRWQRRRACIRSETKTSGRNASYTSTARTRRNKVGSTFGTWNASRCASAAA